MALKLINILETAIRDNSSNYINFDENDFLKGGLARLTMEEKAQVQDLDAQAIFDRIKEESDLNFSYTNGACHDRAHWISMLLSKWGIPHYKVWNFAPSRYSFISGKQLWIKDAFQLSKNGLISSGYHVAPAVFTPAGIMVVDPVVDIGKPLHLKHWLLAQHCDESLYTIIDADWYSFNSFNGLTLQGIGRNGKIQEYTIPYWFPNIITGDFFKYNGRAKKEGWMEQGLAILDLAMLIYDNYVAPDLEQPSPATLDRIALLNQIENMEALFRYKVQNQFIDMKFLYRNKDFVHQYTMLYEQLVQQWIDRVAAC